MDSADSASEAPQGDIASTPIRANGCRRVTLDMRAWYDRADSFKGLPDATAKPFEFLYAFKAAEPYLGLPSHAYKLVDWLVEVHQAPGLGGGEPAHCMATGSAPGGVSRDIAKSRSDAQSRDAGGRHLRDARRSARKAIRLP
jgi:hypothetical protein